MKIAVAILVVVTVVAILLAGMRWRASRRTEEGPKFSQEEYERHHEAKKAALERILGPMHDMVGHAIIPFQVGGAVDMHYFVDGIPGTGFATMELIEPDGSGPKPNEVGTYELVAFTKLRKPPGDERANEGHPFNRIERRMCGIMTTVGFYSYEAVLNPGDTCEVPGKEGEPNRCLVLDEYDPDAKGFTVDGRKHCLLLCIEVFREEMEYAKQNGSDALLRRLKDAGHYPYSDLDREPVL